MIIIKSYPTLDMVFFFHSRLLNIAIMGDLESNIYMYITCDIIMISHGISLVNPMKIMIYITLKFTDSSVIRDGPRLPSWQSSPSIVSIWTVSLSASGKRRHPPSIFKVIEHDKMKGNGIVLPSCYLSHSYGKITFNRYIIYRWIIFHSYVK